MKRLQNVRISWLGARSADVDPLISWLRSEGAEVSVTAKVEATADAVRSSPAVWIIDYRVDADAAARALATLRSDASSQKIAAIGLVSPTSTLPTEVDAVRCNKYVASPVHPLDLVSAVASLIPADATETPSEGASQRTREDMYRRIVEAHAMRNDLRALLGFVNTTGPFRFTSLIRFEDDEKLSSVWTYDRQNPEVDSFPLDLPTTSSYCSYVRESLTPFTMPDAAEEPRASNHPARHTVLAYCGVPLLREDGSFFGTLCQFDAVPRYFQDVTVRRLSDAAAALTPYLPALSRKRE